MLRPNRAGWFAGSRSRHIVSVRGASCVFNVKITFKTRFILLKNRLFVLCLQCFERFVLTFHLNPYRNPDHEVQFLHENGALLRRGLHRRRTLLRRRSLLDLAGRRQDDPRVPRRRQRAPRGAQRRRSFSGPPRPEVRQGQLRFLPAEAPGAGPLRQPCRARFREVHGSQRQALRAQLPDERKDACLRRRRQSDRRRGPRGQRFLCVPLQRRRFRRYRIPGRDHIVRVPADRRFPDAAPRDQLRRPLYRLHRR